MTETPNWLGKFFGIVRANPSIQPEKIMSLIPEIGGDEEVLGEAFMLKKDIDKGEAVASAVTKYPKLTISVNQDPEPDPTVVPSELLDQPEEIDIDYKPGPMWQPIEAEVRDVTDHVTTQINELKKIASKPVASIPQPKVKKPQPPIETPAEPGSQIANKETTDGVTQPDDDASYFTKRLKENDPYGRYKVGDIVPVDKRSPMVAAWMKADETYDGEYSVLTENGWSKINDPRKKGRDTKVEDEQTLPEISVVRVGYDDASRKRAKANYAAWEKTLPFAIRKFIDNSKITGDIGESNEEMSSVWKILYANKNMVPALEQELADAGSVDLMSSAAGIQELMRRAAVRAFPVAEGTDPQVYANAGLSLERNVARVQDLDKQIKEFDAILSRTADRALEGTQFAPYVKTERELRDKIEGSQIVRDIEMWSDISEAQRSGKKLNDTQEYQLAKLQIKYGDRVDIQGSKEYADFEKERAKHAELLTRLNIARSSLSNNGQMADLLKKRNALAAEANSIADLMKSDMAKLTDKNFMNLVQQQRVVGMIEHAMPSLNQQVFKQAEADQKGIDGWSAIKRLASGAYTGIMNFANESLYTIMGMPLPEPVKQIGRAYTQPHVQRSITDVQTATITPKRDESTFWGAFANTVDKAAEMIGLMTPMLASAGGGNMAMLSSTFFTVKPDYKQEGLMAGMDEGQSELYANLGAAATAWIEQFLPAEKLMRLESKGAIKTLVREAVEKKWSGKKFAQAIARRFDIKASAIETLEEVANGITDFALAKGANALAGTDIQKDPFAVVNPSDVAAIALTTAGIKTFANIGTSESQSARNVVVARSLENFSEAMDAAATIKKRMEADGNYAGVARVDALIDDMVAIQGTKFPPGATPSQMMVLFEGQTKINELEASKSGMNKNMVELVDAEIKKVKDTMAQVMDNPAKAEEMLASDVSVLAQTLQNEGYFTIPNTQNNEGQEEGQEELLKKQASIKRKLGLKDEDFADQSYTTEEDAEFRATLPDSGISTEEDLKQQLETGEFAMLTAQNPQATPLTKEANARLNKKAEKWLKDRGLKPVPIYGKYGNSERSFYVPGMTRDQAVEFAKAFDQESVAHSSGLVYQDGSYNPRTAGVDTTPRFEDGGDFFSTMNVGGKPVDFSINYDFEQRMPAPKKVTPIKEIRERAKNLQTVATTLQEGFKKLSGKSVEVVFDQAEVDAAFDSRVADGRASIEETERMKEVAAGMVYKGKVYLNPRAVDMETPIHEFGHLWRDYVKESRRDVYDAVYNVIRNSQYYKDVEADPSYAFLKAKGEEAIVDEALARAIGEMGAKIVEPTLQQKFIEFLEAIKKEIQKLLGTDRVDVLTASFDDVIKGINAELFTGELVLTTGETITAKPDPNAVPDPELREAFQYVGEKYAKKMGGDILKNLAIAKAMDKAPSSRFPSKEIEVDGDKFTLDKFEQIRLQTGWFKDTRDGKWRYEIPNEELISVEELLKIAEDWDDASDGIPLGGMSAMSLGQLALAANSKGVLKRRRAMDNSTLKKIAERTGSVPLKKFLEAYPSENKTIVKITRTANPFEVGGDTSPGTNRINVRFLDSGNGRGLDDKESAFGVYRIFFHELQHRIQFAEGFARGSNASFAELDLKKYADKEFPESKYPDRDEARELAIEKLGMQYYLPGNNRVKRAVYERSAGEIEAENSAKRSLDPQYSPLNPEIRVILEDPRLFDDVKPEHAIVIYSTAAEWRDVYDYVDDMWKAKNKREPGGAEDVLGDNDARFQIGGVTFDAEKVAKDTEKLVVPGKQLPAMRIIGSKNKVEFVKYEGKSTAKAIRESSPKQYYKRAVAFANSHLVPGRYRKEDHDKNPTPEELKWADKIYEKAKATIVKNLLALYDAVPPQIRALSKLWYDGANKIAQEYARVYGYTVEQVAGAIATQSPKKEWFANLHLAQMLVQFHKNKSEKVFTQEAYDFFMEKAIGSDPDDPSYEKQITYGKTTLINVIGKPAKDLDNYQLAALARFEYETQMSVYAPIRTPLGHIVDTDKNKSAINAYAMMERSFNILDSNDMDVLSKNLGADNKVRNFYNNIIDPTSADYVTIDTHAIAAGYLLPIGQKKPEVKFDPATYGLFADAYAEAAAQRGVLPREMQSITWEAVRAMFPDTVKGDVTEKGTGKKILNPFEKFVRDEWAKFDTGKQTIEQVQQNIFNHAKSGKPGETNWARYADNIASEGGNSSYVEELPFTGGDRYAFGSGVRGDNSSGLPRVGGRNRWYDVDESTPDARLHVNKDLVKEAKLDKYMTDDGDGNYVFFHYSGNMFRKTDPNRFGSNLFTGRDENPGVGMTMFYTRKGDRERGLSGKYSYTVKVPKNKVYPFNRDPLNLYDEAEREFREVFGDRVAFDPNKQVGYITKVAARYGYEMTVAEWGSGKSKTLRAQSTKSLPVERVKQPEEVDARFQMLAPNGKPSNLTPSQYAQVRTPEFKAWFGDWENDPENASKVVDENGEPRIVYHGTNHVFNEFKKDLLGSKNFLAESAYEGFFFAGDRKTSEAYTGMNSADLAWLSMSDDPIVKSSVEKYKDELDAAQEAVRETEDKIVSMAREEAEARAGKSVSQLREVLGGVANQALVRKLIDDMIQLNINEAYEKAAKANDDNGNNERLASVNEKIRKEIEREFVILKGLSPNIMELYLNIRDPHVFDYSSAEPNEGITNHILAAKKNSNDGVILNNLADGADIDDIFVVFEPTQVKSATSNTGSFDPDNPDIRYQINATKEDISMAMHGFAGQPGVIDMVKAGESDQDIIEQIELGFPDMIGTGVPENMLANAKRIAARPEKVSSVVPSGIRKVTAGDMKDNRRTWRKTMGRKLRRWLRDNLGNLDAFERRIRQEKERSSGKVNYMMRKAERLGKHIHALAYRIKFSDWATMKTALGDYDTKLTPKQNKDKQLKAFESLPVEMQIATRQFRSTIDGITRELIINGYVSPDQAVKLSNNEEQYVTRAYRIFEQDDYAKKIMSRGFAKDVYLAAKAFITNQKLGEAAGKLGQGATPEEIRYEAERMAELDLDTRLKEIEDAFKGGGSAESRRNLETLLQRQDIPKEIRDLYGEYTDPISSFLMSVLKNGETLAASQMLDQISKVGKGTFIFSTPREGFTKRISAENNPALQPMDGMYTSDDVYDYIFGGLPNGAYGYQGWFWNTYRGLVGTVRWGLVVGSPMSNFRNFTSNFWFALANGHWRVFGAPKDSSALKYLFNTIKPERYQQELGRMIDEIDQLNLLNQGVGVREIKRFFRNRSLDRFGDDLYDMVNNPHKEVWKPYAVTRKIVAGTKAVGDKFFRVGDDFWKVYAFMNEASAYADNLYKKKYMELTDEERARVNDAAAEIVKSTTPYYDRAYGMVRNYVSAAPWMTNFLTFTSETVRVTRNIAVIAAREIADPRTRASGFRRVAGFILYNSVRGAYNYWKAKAGGAAAQGFLVPFIESMLGVGDDDDRQKTKDIKRLLYSFLENNDIGVKDNGDGIFLITDISSADPMNFTARIVNAMAAEEDPFKSVLAGMTVAIDPLLQKEIVVDALADVAFNKGSKGETVYVPGDPTAQIIEDVLSYIGGKIKPGAWKSVDRIMEAEDKWEEFGTQALGMRTYKLDPVNQFSRKLNTRAMEIAQVTGKEYERRREAADDEEAKEVARQMAEDALQKIADDIRMDYDAVIRLVGTTGDEKVDNDVAKRVKEIIGYRVRDWKYVDQGVFKKYIMTGVKKDSESFVKKPK